ALLDADVNYKIAKDFTNTVKEKALGQKVVESVKPGQLMVKIVNDELANLMGGTAAELNLEGNPTVILLAGLQGSGKTTMAGKLARFFRDKHGKNPMLVASDVAAGRRFLAWQGKSPPSVAVLTGKRWGRRYSKNLITEWYDLKTDDICHILSVVSCVIMGYTR
ncbi:MAG: signal recognition particle receptor subunit alpha, partial [Desulfobacteraceae bacterium]